MEQRFGAIRSREIQNNGIEFKMQKWIFNTWHQYHPEWFITLLWNDCPTDPVTASSHTRILRRMMLENYLASRTCQRFLSFLKGQR